MPDHRTVVCNARTPQNVADGRVVPVGATADRVDITDPQNKALIDAGALAVRDSKRGGRKASTTNEEETAK